jgi:hypothetical protein
MCIKTIAERFDLSLDLQELLEKHYVLRGIKGCNRELWVDYQPKNYLGDEKVDLMRFRSRETKNFKNKKSIYAGMGRWRRFTIDEKLSGGGTGCFWEGKIIDGIPVRYDRRASKLEICGHGEAVKVNSKFCWMLTKQQIMDKLKEREIKFNKSKNKGQLVRILWSSKD